MVPNAKHQPKAERADFAFGSTLLSGVTLTRSLGRNVMQFRTQQGFPFDLSRGALQPDGGGLLRGKPVALKNIKYWRSGWRTTRAAPRILGKSPADHKER